MKEHSGRQRFPASEHGDWDSVTRWIAAVVIAASAVILFVGGGPVAAQGWMGGDKSKDSDSGDGGGKGHGKGGDDKGKSNGPASRPAAYSEAPVLSFAPPSDVEVIYEDAKITGKVIHFFSDKGQNVSVVLGGFRLCIGERVVSGKDAVVWVNKRTVGEASQFDITMYIEGDAKVVEPGGTTTGDRVMVVTVHTQGRLIADGMATPKDLSDFGLYTRAKEFMDSSRTAPPEVVAGKQTALNPRPGPEFTVVRPQTFPVAGTSQPATGPWASTRPTTGPASRPAPKPPGPPRVEPVRVMADNVKMEIIGDKVRGERRVFILTGNVRVSKGAPSSDLAVEMRAQSAVLFTQKATMEKDSRSPLSFTINGAESSLAGPQGAKEVPSGVYLEEDVILSQGERYMRGPRVYYDLLTDRAIVIDPVFKMIVAQRNIPIYVRADEARMLSSREFYFTNAKISSSDFQTPDYHIGAGKLYLEDTSPYDENNQRLGQPTWYGDIVGATFNIFNVPVIPWPEIKGDFEQDTTPIKRIQIGKQSDMGFGVETEWDLFRLMGLVTPEGFRGNFNFDYYDHAVASGVDIKYNRDNYSGYDTVYGLIDRYRKDTFGQEEENIPAPEDRGRILMRHKQILEDDWTVQAELSYVSDKNFMEEYYRDEWLSSKPGETDIYAKKQKDNWAFDALLQYRLNHFQSQTDSYPDLGFYLIGEPLMGDKLTYFNEDHLGVKKFEESDTNTDPANPASSNLMVRGDTRNEIDAPMHIGAFNIVPYVVGRATAWSDTVGGSSDDFRPYGEVGVKANEHFWRNYSDVQSRMWDVNGLKHVITPELDAFLSETDVEPDDLYPMDPGIEQHLGRTDGISLALLQRLVTSRGEGAAAHKVDWMTLNLSIGLFDDDNKQNNLPAGGQWFFDRPEYSLPRDFVNGEYTWAISDSTEFLTDINYDIKSNDIGLFNAGIAVQRDPRFRYYLGLRYIRALDSSVGTAGINYKINKKYSISLFEQYDFLFDNGKNLASSISIIRKLPRWYVAGTLTYDATKNDVSFMVTIWPEGAPELKIGGNRMGILGPSSNN
jgi:hypothetical protein